MTYARKVDANQEEIVKAMRQIGAKVTSLARLGHGVSDLLVSFRQRWLVMEVKTADGKLTPDEKEWVGDQRAPVYIVRSPLEAVAILQSVKP